VSSKEDGVGGLQGGKGIGGEEGSSPGGNKRERGGRGEGGVARRRRVEGAPVCLEHCPGQYGVKIGRVYVWDLDETLIVFNSLLTGSFMEGKKMDMEKVRALSTFASRIEDMIYDLADRGFFFKSLDGRNEWCFDSAQEHDDATLDPGSHNFAGDGLVGVGEGSGGGSVGGRPGWERRLEGLRYRVVREKYERARTSMEAKSEVLGQKGFDGAKAATDAVDELTDGWLKTADEVLSKIWQFETAVDRLFSAQTPSTHLHKPDEILRYRKPTSEAAVSNVVETHINVLVTNGELVPTTVKLLLFGLEKHFHPSCIYSSRDVGKTACFSDIVRRFG